MNRNQGLAQRFHLDGWLALLMVLLCAIGLLVLHSASGQSEQMLARQGVRIGVGLVVMIAVAQLPPPTLARWIPALYLAGMGLLVTVIFFGTGRSAARWLDIGILRFQPAEMMKLVVPITAAWFLAESRLPPSMGRVLATLALIVLPVVLVARQPDLGTALLIGAAGCFVLFLAGVRWRYMLYALLASLVTAPLLWSGMHEYQRQRVLTLLSPESDPLGAGYHIIQSKIAVGSGGLFGKGWMNGTQSRLEFVPERSTDFIFSVFCEEFGFLGVCALLAVYALIILRGFYIAANAQGVFARLTAGALTFTLFIYVYVNMSMVIGALPVVGIPLPLVSYGGTSLVTLLIGFGILMSVHTHRRLLSSA